MQSSLLIATSYLLLFSGILQLRKMLLYQMDPVPINSINLTFVTLPSKGVTAHLKNTKYLFKFNSLLPLNNSLFFKTKSTKNYPDTSNAKYIFNLFLWLFPLPCSLSQIFAYLYNINIFILSDIYLNCFMWN